MSVDLASGATPAAGAGAAVTCGEVAGELAGDIPVRSVAGLAFGEPQHADIFDPRPPQSFGWAGSSSSQGARNEVVGT